jgi:HEAT repeat protein
LHSAIPELNDDEDDETSSTLGALIEHRILSELVVNNQSRISFNIADIGGYLLSFELERQTQAIGQQEVEALLRKWVEESLNFQPLLDALLALMDRFADQPYSSSSLALVKALVESHRFRHSSIFGLMRPEVLKTIFEIIKEADGQRLHGYRPAALGIRPTPAALAEIRSHLNDKNAAARQLAAELAGALHDEVAIEELIQLFRDPDKDVQRKVFQAFGHIGRSAIGPLLKVINDSSQAVELRSSCITALRSVGFRNREVSATLKSSLEQSECEPELVKRSLLAAAGLRERVHTRYATQALESPDDQVVTSAGKYLTEVPDANAFSALRQALKPKSLALYEPPERFGIVNQLTAALWRTDKIKAAPILLKLVERGLKSKGDLLPFQAVYFPNKIDLPAVPPLILKAMVKQLQQRGEGDLVWRGSSTLGAIWRFEQLQALIAENKVLKRQGIDTARLFVDAIVPGIQISEEFPLGNRLNLISDLHTLAKCQAANLASEAVRLFEHSGAIACAELSRLMWVAGDTRVEKTLLHRMANPSEEREARHERSDLVRALGTCGESTQAVEVVLDFMRADGDDNISYDFEDETLQPLLYRRIISDTQLIEVALDTTMPWPSRRASLLTLGWYDANKYQDVFARVAAEAVDQPMLQGAAIVMLSVPCNKSVVPQLRRFLRESQDVTIKAEAARALARLDDVSSVHEIERAFESADAPDFASALARFRQESSLPVLIDRLSSAPYQWKYGYLRALGAFWKFPQGKAAVFDQFDGWSDPQEQYLNNQEAIIDGLVEYEPDVILDQFNKSFDDGDVTTRARETMAKRLADLFDLRHANDSLLLQVAKRLISDEHVPARERACHALRFAKRSFCLQLFKTIHDAPGISEWERACAIYSLGFLSGPTNLIEAARFDEELLVRRAADAALEVNGKRPHLEKHIKRYNSQNGLARLSSYLCLAEQGDQSTIWALHNGKKISEFSQTFREDLSERIKKRLADEYKKKSEEEKKLANARGTIKFD